MRRLFLSFLLLLTSVALFSQNSELREGNMKFQGQSRQYYVYVPDSLGTGSPLVIMLHGHGGNARKFLPSFLTSADEHGFAICFPQGLKEPGGDQKPSWNVGYPMQEGWKVDDCAFLLALAKRLHKLYGIDLRNVFITGMSNGGEMCYLMAARYPDKVAAIASLAGLNMEWIYREIKSDVPVPFMEVHGTEDHVSEWGGDVENVGGWGSYISVPQAIGRRVSVNCCTHSACDTLPLYAEGRHRVVLHSYYGGTDNKNVYLYEIIGGNHSMGEKDMDLMGRMWDFFSTYITR